MDEDAAGDRRHAVQAAGRGGGAANDEGKIHAGAVVGGEEDEIADKAWRGACARWESSRGWTRWEE